MIVADILLFVSALFLIWLAAEMIIEGIERISKKTDVSSFSASFFILGLLTCIPELAIGVTSIISHKPEIFMGDLIGGAMVLFLCVIPLLAIFGNSIRLSHYLSESNLILALFVVLTPTMFTLDGTIYRKGGIFMILLYLMLFAFMHRGREIVSKFTHMIPRMNRGIFLDLFIIICGVGLISIASKILVEKTIAFAQLFHISAYLISLLVLSIGTNLPEMFIAIRSVMANKKEIAFGNYIGSAVTNTLLFGIFTLINGPITLADGQFMLTFFLFLTGLVLFYAFSRSDNELTRKEGFWLIIIYIMFVILEILL